MRRDEMPHPHPPRCHLKPHPFYPHIANISVHLFIRNALHSCPVQSRTPPVMECRGGLGSTPMLPVSDMD
jgi:hypothetical protein